MSDKSEFDSLTLIQRGMMITRNDCVFPIQLNWNINKNVTRVINIDFEFIGNDIDFLTILPHSMGIKRSPDIITNWADIDTTYDNSYAVHLVQKQWAPPGIIIINQNNAWSHNIIYLITFLVAKFVNTN